MDMSVNRNKHMSTGYFTSVVDDVKEHVVAFILCPKAQVYWWLCRRGCITEDVNHLIRHCFTLSQQQKVTESKYIKDLGHAVIDQDDADNIIHAATTQQGIYDLTLGLSDKERRRLVAGMAYKASAITFGEAKEGAMEAHNFSLQASITTIHMQNEKKQDATSVASARTLAKSVFSIGTSTSKVTEDDVDESEEEDNSKDGRPQNKEPRSAIVGM
jgi:hypothetical protein